MESIVLWFRDSVASPGFSPMTYWLLYEAILGWVAFSAEKHHDSFFLRYIGLVFLQFANILITRKQINC